MQFRSVYILFETVCVQFEVVCVQSRMVFSQVWVVWVQFRVVYDHSGLFMCSLEWFMPNLGWFDVGLCLFWVVLSSLRWFVLVYYFVACTSLGSQVLCNLACFVSSPGCFVSGVSDVNYLKLNGTFDEIHVYSK